MLSEIADQASVKPTSEQPGTLGEQIATLITSLLLADHRGTTAAEQWQAARALCIPHARGKK